MSSFEVEFQDCTHVYIQWSLDNKVSDLSQSPSKESEQLDWTVKPLKTSSLEMFTLTTKTGAGTVSVCWERDLYSNKDGLLCKTTVSKPSAWILQSAEF